MRVEIYGDAATNTVSGDTVQFTADDAIPVKSLEAQITPSIAGNQSVTITANGQTTEVSLEKAVYGGGVNVTTGLVTETHGGGAYDPSAVPADLASKIRSATTERSASGEVAAFSCTLGEFPMSAVSTTLTPTQDLHGYDRPWPGGGGVNLWPDALPANAIAATFSGAVINGASNARVFAIPVKRNTSYWLQQDELNKGWDGVAFSTKLPEVGDAIDFRGNMTNRGDWVLNSGEHDYLLCQVATVAAFEALVTTYHALVAEGSTATAWTPYSNICPITGRTGLNVWDDPKYGGTVAWNQLMENGDFQSASGWYPISGTVSNGVFSYTTSSDGPFNCTFARNVNFVENHKFLISCKAKCTVGNVIRVRYPFVSGPMTLTANTWSEFTAIGIGTTTAKSIGVQFNSVAGQTNSIKEFVAIDLTAMFGSTIADYIYSIEQATAGAGVAWFRKLFPKDYYPYDNSYTATCVSAVNGDPYTKVSVDWTTEAGTVYGGTLDVVTGVLTVTMTMVDLGTLTWIRQADTSQVNPNGTFYTSTSPCPFKGWNNAYSNAASNVLAPATSSGTSAREANSTFWWNNAATEWRIIWGKPNGGSTIDELRALLADLNVTVVAELATPLTIQLSPTQVSTILGQNRVWSDSGETSVTYRDGSLSNVSNIMTNSTALTTGENITYTLSQQRTYQIPGTVIRTVEGNNVMSANTGKITVTWSSPWFDITPWIAYQGLTFSRNDVDAPDAGRDMSGYMHRGRVGVKEKMNITTVQLTRAQSSTLQTLLYPETIQVRVTPYPRTNAAHTMSMYTNNVKTTYVIHRENGEDLQSLTFPLIEN